MINATFSGFDAALSALRANQKKLNVVGQNLANMNVEGYTRQELQTASLHYDYPLSFATSENDASVGTGVSIQGIRQLRDQFLDSQYRIQNGRADYQDTIRTSLSALSAYLDESSIDGIRAAFDDIQTSLTNMQDPAKVNDPVYEGELMSRMQALTTLMNAAAENIRQAEKNEFNNLSGGGTSENGSVEKINRLLQNIGELNQKIRQNQLSGSPALELLDLRNTALDELSSYIPIEVESFSEQYTVLVGEETQVRSRIYNYDENGNITGRSNWPEELRVSLLYTDSSGTPAVTRRVTLVNGSIGGDRTDSDGLAGNVGHVEISGLSDATGENPLDVSLRFRGAESFDADASGTDSRFVSEMTTDTASARFDSGSVQASLDMLSSSSLDQMESYDQTSLKQSSQMNYYSYDFYMDKLDILVHRFAEDMNEVNRLGNTLPGATAPEGEDYLLLVNRQLSSGDAQDSAEGITAANISISRGWVNGTVHIGTCGFERRETDPQTGELTGSSSDQGDKTDTVMRMLEYMQSSRMTMNKTATSYSDYMNNVSTTLATDAGSNSNSCTINQAVLQGLQTSRDQISGVSLDEEAANMMTFTTSYNAAARLMTALDEALKTLLSIAS